MFFNFRLFSRVFSVSGDLMTGTVEHVKKIVEKTKNNGTKAKTKRNKNEKNEQKVKKKRENNEKKRNKTDKKTNTNNCFFLFFLIEVWIWFCFYFEFVLFFYFILFFYRFIEIACKPCHNRRVS